MTGGRITARPRRQFAGDPRSRPSASERTDHRMCDDPAMDYEALVQAIDDSGRSIVDALGVGDPTTTVPTCPDFTLDRLAFHIGEFSSFWTHVLCEATGREKPDFPTDPGPDGRRAWVEGILAHLVEELGHADGSTRCWTWYEPDQTAGFVASRACHELAIHRVDVQLAALGTADVVAAPVAAAGIEEVFLLLDNYGVDGQRGTPGNGETLHLHGLDHHPADWFVRLDPSKPVVTREAADADLTINGTVSDIEMLLYQRPTVSEVEWIGDRRVLDAFHGEFTFG